MGVVLSLVAERRGELIERMAQLIVMTGTEVDERDAIRALLHAGYSHLQVFRLVDDARYVAQQERVAREMSRP